MNYLLLTLGHNSSAIFVEVDENKAITNIIGYEQERLSGIKGDSQFPIDAINEICKNTCPASLQGCKIFISHWFDFSNESIPNKYITGANIDWLKSFNPCDIVYVNKDFTHHDAHAFSAWSFFKYNIEEYQKSDKPVHIIVADGFGNNKEVISIYKSYCSCNQRPLLIDRFYGYDISLGLMYQYATSFVGMKENQDEYKFLGYEALADKYFTQGQIYTILSDVRNTVDYYFIDKFTDDLELHKQMPKSTEKLIDFTELKSIKRNWHNKFYDILNNLNISSQTSDEARVAIALYIQQVIEQVIRGFIAEYNMQNVIVVGGCFYNVKLNNAVLKNIPGLFCAMPLAGDQGAAIGMLEYYEGVSFPFKTLAIGTRNFYGIEKLFKNQQYKNNINIYSATYFDEFYSDIINKLAQDIADGKMVNIVTRNMEFGPRALCNTSTLFLPTKKNAEKNNRMNGRNEVMPFAPLCTAKNASLLFNEYELGRIIGSDYFMICTHNYKKHYSKQYAGVMHKKTLEDDIYTGRPQIVKAGSFIDFVLTEVNALTDTKCLVNTSFNVHGHPIVFSLAQIIDNFNYQCEQCELHNEELPVLYIINDNE